MKTMNPMRSGNYTCVVCIKQVPDTKKVTGAAMKSDGTVNRAALAAIFNPEDRQALEAALRVREACGGKVIALTMGLPSACAILREALMCGADEAYLVTDRKAAGSDTLATSYILSQAVRKFNPDLVFCGRQAIDGDTAQVGPQIGEKLDYAVVTYLQDLTMEGSIAVAVRDIGTGIETCRVKLPALFTVTEKLGALRPLDMKRVMRYKKAKCPAETTSEEERAVLAAKGLLIGQLSCDDIGCEASRCGFAGSPTSVNKIESVVLTGGSYKNVPPTEEGLTNLVTELIHEHTIG